MTIKNKGEGAARITGFSLESNGQEYASWNPMFSYQGQPVSLGLTRTFEPDDVIGANEELVLCTLPRGKYDLVKIRLTINYVSLYDEPFEFSTTFTLGG